jgi:ATP-dependent DNA helicase DinG
MVPAAPAVVAGVRNVAWISPAGEVAILAPSEAAGRVRAGAVPLVCHAPDVARRLGLPVFPALDVLELFAFVRPARFCVPTVKSLARRLLLPVPDTLVSEAETLPAIARTLLAELNASPGEDAAAVAAAMAAGGWPWTEPVLTALGRRPDTDDARAGAAVDGLKVWRRLADWEDPPAAGPADAWPVEPVEARARLVRLLGGGAEQRPQQMQYASHAAGAFRPRDRQGEPRIALAEAGTGIGKTLGYIAPATLWAQKNGGTVWISTFTRNLQRQLDRELDRAYPDFAAKATKVVVRKGRENLFCLLNFEDAVTALSGRLESRDAVALGLVARWAAASRDGDMVGGDFPAWLADLLGPRLTVQLTDTRGECIYSACPHFRRCFVERAIRKARRAEVVVANHALVMIQAARGGDDGAGPTRYVFDEAHHLFDAADGAFSLALSGLETAELRRWLRGAEAGGRSRRRGLRERAGELFADGGEGLEALEAVVAAARTLPGPGWRQRLAAGSPLGAAETFLARVRAQVLARNPNGDRTHGLEAGLRPAVPELIEAADALDRALGGFVRPLAVLVRRLGVRLDVDAASLDTVTRQRIEGVRRSLIRRAVEPIAGWRAMLDSVDADPPPEYVDWIGIERSDGQELDVGLFRHWLDPMWPFANTVLRAAHGALLTSATLRDASGDEEADWAAAEARTGVRHLDAPPAASTLASPFDYGRNTRVLIVGDVDRDDAAQVAAAVRELFLAAGGGGLGLFTAVHRLKAVHAAIAPRLEAAGIRLLAQHVDALDLGSLIDIFREEEDTCLLGTDAVRDGVDVPGRSLRLIVFDRVPWPRPTLLHRARRDAFGGRVYDEMLVRLKLKQAYGRLIRRADDRGVFVMLDRQLPSRLMKAFPEGVPVRRLGLREAIEATRSMLSG